MRKIHWYLSTADAAANESLMEYLSTTCDAGQDKTQQEVSDHKGNLYKVIEVKYPVVRLAKKCGLKVKVFMRSGEDGPVQEWKLYEHWSRTGRTKKIAVVRRQIQQILRKGKSGEDHKHNKSRGG